MKKPLFDLSVAGIRLASRVNGWYDFYALQYDQPEVFGWRWESY
jgi:hypothetical protein